MSINGSVSQCSFELPPHSRRIAAESQRNRRQITKTLKTNAIPKLSTYWFQRYHLCSSSTPSLCDMCGYLRQDKADRKGKTRKKNQESQESQENQATGFDFEIPLFWRTPHGPIRHFWCTFNIPLDAICLTVCLTPIPWRVVFRGPGYKCL